MAEMDLTTVALVNGRSLGGGCELMAFCDIVVASEKARIGQPEIAVGVYPPVAAAWFPKIIGLKKTYELLLTGKIINGQGSRSYRAGNCSTARGELQGRGREISCRLPEQEQACGHVDEEGHQSRLERRFPAGPKASEIIYHKGCMATEDAKEGITAFMEKRKAVWKDK